jgi:hypothetical protein
MSNIAKGQFSVQAGLIMLAIDIVLYGVLGLYFDNVIPSKNALFCVYITILTSLDYVMYKCTTVVILHVNMNWLNNAICDSNAFNVV